MIKEAWPQQKFFRLFNCCLKQMTFPCQYKVLHIRVLLKCEDKKETDPKSYRPISLLLVTGKILRKAITGRLKHIVNNYPRLSSRKYEFRPGRSAKDTIVELVRIVGSTQRKSAVGLLFDIMPMGWWPSILWNFKERGCPRHLRTSSKLLNRPKSENNRNTAKKRSHQGFSTDPTLLEPHIRLGNPNCGSRIVDDFIVVVNANTRKEIEEKASNVTRALSTWGKQKLELSTRKSGRLSRH